VALLRAALDEGRQVVVGIMDTPQTKRNPFTVQQRREMFIASFAREIAEGRMELLVMPWMDEVCYGRDCGWRVRHIDLPEHLREISGTEIRKGLAHV
jgi:hypothetical protein